MKEAQSWLDKASDATPAERKLLQAGSEFEPPPGAQEEVWRALVAALPPPGGADGSGHPESPPAGLSSTSAGVVKSIAAGTLVGLSVAGAGFYLASEKAAPAPRTEASVAAHAQRASQPVSSSPLTHLPPVTAPEPSPPLASPGAGSRLLPKTSAHPQASGDSQRPALPSSAAFPPAPSPVEASALRALKEESELLGQVRAALRAGNSAQALALLATAEQRFAAGALSQEREALMIEALAMAGRRAEASARAREFLARHPESPHVARVRPFAR